MKETQEKIGELTAEVMNITDILKAYIRIIDLSDSLNPLENAADILANGLVGVVQYLTRIADDLEEIDQQLQRQEPPKEAIAV